MKKIFNTIIVISCLFFLGCEISEDAMTRLNTLPQNNYIEQEDPLKPVASDSIAKHQGSSKLTIEDSRMWAQKIKQLEERNQNFKIQNQELAQDNERLRKRYNAMKDTLESTEKELDDANDMLIEMRKELDGWKMDVLGHREEIDAQHKAQMEALIKILKLMGAEYVEQN